MRPRAHLSLAALVAAAALLAAPARAAGTEPSAYEPPASAAAVRHYLRARLTERAGDLAAALRELERALLHDESSAGLRVAHAELLVRSRAVQRAEAEARRALELAPTGPAAARARLLLGQIASVQRRFDTATRELREAAALEAAEARRAGRRPDPAPWRALADALSRAGDDAGAARALEELAALLPAEASEGLAALADVALEQRDAARAERHLRRATALVPSDPAPWRRLARLLEALRRRGEARAAWEAAVRADPDDPEALLGAGRLAAAARDLPAAHAWFRQLVAADDDPDAARVSAAFAWLEALEPREALAVLGTAAPADPDPRVHAARGIALQELRRCREALEAFARVPREGGDLDALARSREALCRSELGEHAEALAVVERARAARPRDVRLLGTAAHVLVRAGRPGEAGAVLERALADVDLRGGEDAPELYAALAEVLLEAGRPQDAVRVLRGALDERPRDATLRFALGMAHERTGRLDDALAEMRALLALDPDHANALNFVGYSYAERGERLDEAEALVRRALEVVPENPAFLDSLGWVYFQKGDGARAVEALERAAEREPEPTVLEHLGDAYRRVGRDREAAAAYRRALGALDAEPRAAAPAPRREEQRAGIERKIRELVTLR